MPLRHYYDGRIAIVTLTYEAAPHDASPALRAIASDERLAGVPLLIDARSCHDDEAPGRSCERIEQVLAALRASRYAIVGGRPFGKCAACRAFRQRARAHGRDVRVYHELGSALRWLWRLDEGAWPGLCALPEAA
jgi:hypothetical protein